MNLQSNSLSPEQKAHSLRHDLSQFTGTQSYYFHPMYPWLKYTDGVRFLLREAGAYWLLDKLGTELAHKFANRLSFWAEVLITSEDDQVHILVLERAWNEQRKATDVVCVLDAMVSPHTFPPGQWSLVFNHRVMCLPSED